MQGAKKDQSKEIRNATSVLGDRVFMRPSSAQKLAGTQRRRGGKRINGPNSKTQEAIELEKDCSKEGVSTR